MANPKKVLGAAKKRAHASDAPFHLDEERLRVAERALGSQPNNNKLRKELSEVANHFYGLLSLWRQAPSPATLHDEAGRVLSRIDKGADVSIMLNARPYIKKTLTEMVEGDLRKCDDKLLREAEYPAKFERKLATKRRAIKESSGISGELLTYLIYQGVDPDTPNAQKVITALTYLRDAPREKTGRPGEYPRDCLFLMLEKIYERELGEPVAISMNLERACGPFIDLCRAMMPSVSLDADGLDLIQAWYRLKKRRS